MKINHLQQNSQRNKLIQLMLTWYYLLMKHVKSSSYGHFKTFEFYHQAPGNGIHPFQMLTLETSFLKNVVLT